MAAEGSETREQSEPALVDRARRQDATAFEALVERYESRVLAITRSICGDRGRSEDAAQEAFVSAWRGLANFDPERPFKPWLFAIARNAARRMHRQRAGQPEDTVPLDNLGLAAGWGQSPERLAAVHERLDVLSACLGRLSQQDREVLWLRDVEGMTGPEAAQALGLTLPTLKTRLHRSRLRLMAELRGGDHAGRS